MKSKNGSDRAGPLGRCFIRVHPRKSVANPCLQRAAYSTPRFIWSRSMLSNRAWKLPSPKPSLPLRWMISKKIGPIAFWVKICSSLRS
jgi:hypothetical protein